MRQPVSSPVGVLLFGNDSSFPSRFDSLVHLVFLISRMLRQGWFLCYSRRLKRHPRVLNSLTRSGYILFVDSSSIIFGWYRIRCAAHGFLRRETFASINAKPVVALYLRSRRHRCEIRSTPRYDYIRTGPFYSRRRKKKKRCSRVYWTTKITIVPERFSSFRVFDGVTLTFV